MFVTIDEIDYNILKFTAYRYLDNDKYPNGIEIHYAGGTKIIKTFDTEADRDAFISKLGDTYIQLNSVYYNALYFSAYYKEDIVSDEPSYNVIVHYGIVGSATKLVFKFTSADDQSAFIDKLQAINSGGGGGGGTSEDATLKQDITSSVAVGATNSGTLFKKGMTFTEFAKKILVKVIAPTIQLTTTSSLLNEIGTTLSNVTLKVNISNLGVNYTSLDKVEFISQGQVLDTQDYQAGTTQYTYEVASLSQTTTYIARVYYTDVDGQHYVYKQLDFKFINSSYYGLVDASSVIDDSIIADLNKALLENHNYTYNNINATDERFVFGYPKSYGELSSIKDANNFEYIDSYTKYDIQIDNVDYLFYVLTDPTTIDNATQIYS